VRDYEVTRLFAVYHQLLGLLEPPDAVKWLVTKQRVLADRQPCVMLAEREDFHRLQAVIAGLVNESKRPWRAKKPTG